MQEFEVNDLPQDGISRVQFCHNGIDNDHMLLVSSWDKTLRLYDTNQNQMRFKTSMDAPLLDCCFSDTNCDVAFSASANYSVYQHHLSQNKSTPIGRHDAGVRSVRYSSRTQSVISGGWDAKVHIWDVKSSTARTGSFEAPGKVYSMSLNENYLLIATSNRQVALYDLRNTDTHVFLKESPLKYQTRCVELCPDNTGFIIGSIEGRVGVEYISQEKKGYSFKCHRQTVDGKTYIFPVNSIAFHPYGTFATGGCDGVICVWDGIKKKRISQFRTYPTSSDGTKIAIASSYTYEEALKDHPRDSIFIRDVRDSEVQPK